MQEQPETKEEIDWDDRESIKHHKPSLAYERTKVLHRLLAGEMSRRYAGNISAVANTNPDTPQGTVAKVNGVISYEGDIQGTFNGILEKVDDEWILDGTHVTVPPTKIE